MIQATLISDTHGQEPVLPGGDILFHAGDLSVHGYRVEIIKALNYLHEQKDKYKHIILTPGNHDLWAERHPEEFKQACTAAGIILLINDGIVIEGKKIWASPVTPVYHNWAFNQGEGDRRLLWSNIPRNLDVLLTHSPPYGVLDQANDKRLGCIPLRDRVREVKPTYHLFGHVHESPGTTTKKDSPTIYINGAGSVINFDL